MYGWDPDEEPTGETRRRMPPRGHHPRDAYDDGRDFGRPEPYEGRRDFSRRDAYDHTRDVSRPEAYDDPRDVSRRNAYDDPRDFSRRDAYDHTRGVSGPEAYDDGRDFSGRGAYDDEHGFGGPAPVPAAGPAMAGRRRPATGRLRSAGRRVGSVLAWAGLLVFAPLIVGVIAGAIGQHIGL